MTFAIIYDKEQSHLLGSDQLIIIDGRLNIFNAIEYAKNIAKNRKTWNGHSVRIYKGEILNCSPRSGYHLFY